MSHARMHHWRSKRVGGSSALDESGMLSGICMAAAHVDLFSEKVDMQQIQS